MPINIEHHSWKLIERSFHPSHQRAAESLFSLGNGRMGQRANFEEDYSGDSLQGSYLGGIYYPDKTRVGWWKNGYPEYFAKVLNAVNWIGIQIEINGQSVDLAKSKIYDFYRELNMKHGLLSRNFTIKIPGGEKIKVEAQRFLSMERLDIGAISYSIEALNFSGEISLTPYLDFDIKNEDTNYDEKFWTEMDKGHFSEGGYVVARTKKLDFKVASAMAFAVEKEGHKIEMPTLPSARKKFVAQKFNLSLNAGEKIQLKKYAAIASNFYYCDSEILGKAKKQVQLASEIGFDFLLSEHKKVWADNWNQNDIKIEGDLAAQQGIRFNIYQLLQTYTGEDARLNIGPKGFTGEKYGGSTYWDTEAYCMPFYLSTGGQKVARQLLLYRYNHLSEAIKNAQKLGFDGGAALYPMVTMNGEECHNEWEITFEEIHRNGAIAYAIFNYIRYTGDEDYLVDYGLEVLVAISRFWAQRAQFSQLKKQFVILGVTGPNKYENNVNNNWHTNYIARWCLQYTLSSIEKVKKQAPHSYDELLEKIQFHPVEECERWVEIIENMFLPFDEEWGIFLQQEGFLDKEIQPADELPDDQRPINQHWSWDRILRSCFIKQADVLQSLYFFEENFDRSVMEKNFAFYEPLTVHESSLSPCIHSILASRLGWEDKAYEMYLRTARLDLDDYNQEVAEGCHITSMAGTWLAIVEGFAGMRIRSGNLHFTPNLPKAWKAYSFRIKFRGRLLKCEISQRTVRLTLLDGLSISVFLFDREIRLIEDNAQSVNWVEMEVDKPENKV